MKTPSLPKTALFLSAGLLLAGCAGTATHDSTGQYIDDSAITTKVKAALLKDDQVKSFEVHVNTFKGDVQLSGFVDNQDEKNAAGRDAQGIEGVHNVINNITVKTPGGDNTNPPPNNGDNNNGNNNNNNNGNPQ